MNGMHSWEQRTFLLLVTSKGTMNPFGSEPRRNHNFLEFTPKHELLWGAGAGQGLLWHQPGPVTAVGWERHPGAAFPLESCPPELPLDCPQALRIFPPLLNSAEVLGLGRNSLVKQLSISFSLGVATITERIGSTASFPSPLHPFLSRVARHLRGLNCPASHSFPILSLTRGCFGSLCFPGASWKQPGSTDRARAGTGSSCCSASSEAGCPS